MDRFLFFVISLCWISLELNHFTYQQWMIQDQQQQQQQQGDNQRPQQSTQQSTQPRQPLPRRNDGSFSACLLVMDENYRLAEWLSYHYYTFGLRYVIVGVDTRSVTSPTPIFQQFRQELNMTIIEWHDESIYMNRSLQWKGALPEDAPPGRIRKRYMARQLLFLTECMEQLHTVGQSWTALWDPDEYLVIRRESSLLPDYEKGGNKLSTATQDVFKNFFLNQYFGEKTKGSCIAMPRVLMGAQKEEDPSPYELLADLDDDSQRLTTLRWHYHSSEKDSQINGLTKVAMDASALTSLPLPTFRNPHRPLLDICASPHFRDHETSPLRLNHYLGSWHEYSFRNDARKGKERSYEAWQFRAKSCGKRDQSQVELWISGFVQHVKRKKAQRLLETAGVLSSIATRNESEWRVDTNSRIFKKSGRKAFKQFVGQ